MVIWSEFRMGRHRDDDHQEHVPHFGPWIIEKEAWIQYSQLYVKFTWKITRSDKFVTEIIRESAIRKYESVSNKDSKYDETVACSMFLGF